MGVGIDAAGHDEQAVGVDHARVGRRVEVRSHGSDEPVDAWHAGPRRLVDEATLVAMAPADASENVDERAVWLIAPIFDGETRTTSYVVLDAADLGAGPVCELPLPTHIPWGLHGTWVEPGGGAAL